MRRGLKLATGRVIGRQDCAARAAPYEKGTETNERPDRGCDQHGAARAAPYEKGTETLDVGGHRRHHPVSRARGPL